MTEAAGARPIHDTAEGVYDTPVWIPAGSETLFGVLTSPAGAPRHLTVVFFSPHHPCAAGGALGKNDFNVMIAHSMANAGFHVFRYDTHGTGDSTGFEREWNLGRLHTEGVLAVAAELRRRGLDRILLVGKCFGARTVLAAADRVPGLLGVVLISMTLRPPGIGTDDILPASVTPNVGTLLGLFDGRRRRAVLRALYAWLKGTARRMRWPFPGVHPVLLRQVGNVIRARVPLLFLWGNNDADYEDCLQTRKGTLGKLLARGGDLAQVRVIEGDVHDLTTLAVQQRTAACLQDWVNHAAAVAARSPERRPSHGTLGDVAAD